jgi:integrase
LFLLVDEQLKTGLDTDECYALWLCKIMATVHRQPGRPFWFCAFTLFDAETGANKRVFRSTKTRDRKRALEICRTWNKAATLGRKGELSKSAADELSKRAVDDVREASDRNKVGETFARKIVERGLTDIYAKANLEALERAKVREWCETWLQTKSVTTEKSTHTRYQRIIQRFLDFLGKDKSKRDLRALRDDDVERFHTREAKELSPATADLSLNVLRVCFGSAVKKRLLTVNPAASVDTIGGNGDSKRRAFTVSEIKRILKACSDDAEWRGLVIFGLYLGQRLGDLAKLTWRAVNLESGEIAFTARKTGRRIVLPLMQPISDYLASLPARDNPNAFIFPRAASATRTGTLSNQFREVLVSAGLVEPRTQQATGKGRTQARATSEISFHSLRHSAVTMLKKAGVSDVLAREIVGHESAAVSRQYTHLTTDDLRSAMQRLPDVTNA